MTERHALIIEDNPDDARIATTVLQRVGFTIELARSIRQGALTAYEMLERDPPPLVLTDLMLPTDLQSDLDATILIADLVLSMIEGRIRPAHIVVATSTEDQVLHETARLCGARLVIPKPFSMAYAQQLLELYETPPQLPAMSHMLKALGHTSRHALQLLFATEPALKWSKNEVKQLLETPETLEQPWKAWYIRQGGRAVYEHLAQFLTDDERRVLVAMTAPRGLSRRARFELSGWEESTYYRYRARIIEIVVARLNEEQVIYSGSQTSSPASTRRI